MHLVRSPGRTSVDSTIALFRMVPLEALDLFPPDEIQKLVDSAGQVVKTYDEFTKMHPLNGEAIESNAHKIYGAYKMAFENLYRIITFGHLAVIGVDDLQDRLHKQIKRGEKEMDGVLAGLTAHKEEAEKILRDVRLAAADSSISVQAKHFKDEAIFHGSKARIWFCATLMSALCLGLLAFGSLFLHKIPLLKPTDALQASQLVASKLLVFAVFSYLLILSGRNYMSHKHNLVINQHRQNALMTFRALVDGVEDSKIKDV